MKKMKYERPRCIVYTLDVTDLCVTSYRFNTDGKKGTSVPIDFSGDDDGVDEFDGSREEDCSNVDIWNTSSVLKW